MRLFLLAAILLCAGCSPKAKADPLVGDYVAWMFLDGQAVSYDGSMGATQTLSLTPDGKYIYVTETSIMADLKARATGTYKRVGDELVFTGTLSSTMDDGYKKGTESGPHEMKLRIVGAVLELAGEEAMSMYYVKKGSGPPPLPPKMQLKESEPAASELIKKIEATYASVKSIVVTGTVKSEGGGFVAKDARFKLLYQRPSLLRFESDILVGSNTEVERTEITWDGGEKCWWFTDEYGETTDRTLGNAMSIVAVNSGPQVDLLLSLLMPEERAPMGDGAEASLLADETIGSQLCAVLQLKDMNGTVTKLWVAKSSNLVLRIYEELRGVTVNLEPRANAAIRAEEFKLGRRSR